MNPIRAFLERMGQTYYEKKAETLVCAGMFHSALTYIKKINSKEKQKEIIKVNLAGCALAEAEFEDIDYTTDKKEYERFQLLVGVRNHYRYLFYWNPETKKVEGGLEELIDRFIPDSNPLIRYLKNLKK